MASLKEKIQAKRRSNVEAGGWVFAIRRPTDAEMAKLYNAPQEADRYDLACQFTVGWNLKENDIDPGGAADVLPFVPADFAEWLADEPDIYKALGKAIEQAYFGYAKAREEAKKNSKAGSVPPSVAPAS
ncbi:MAG: hypothetical protein ACRCZI_01385 [Cetobacterium sp.]